VLGGVDHTCAGRGFGFSARTDEAVLNDDTSGSLGTAACDGIIEG